MITPVSFNTVTYDRRKGRLRFGMPAQYKQLAGVLRQLVDVTWERHTMSGEAKLVPRNVRTFKGFGYYFDKLAKEEIDKKIQKAILRKGMRIEGVKRELKPFQRLGVEFIEQKNGRALIGDEMGLGKTIQVLAWMQTRPDIRLTVIVCPASIKLNWMRELQNWTTGYTATVLSGKKPCKLISDNQHRVYIINYDILYAWEREIADSRPQLIVLDEAHAVKTPSAKRTKATKRLVKHVPHLLALSGTPVVNRPAEFFSVLGMIDPALFPSWSWYTQRYCDAKWNGFGLDVSGASHTEELHRILIGRVMLRRTKRDVLKELPPKTRTVIPIPIVNIGEYKKQEEELRQMVAQGKSGMNALVVLEYLRQIGLKGKLPLIKNWVEDFIESGEKLVLFGHHTEGIDFVQSVFPKCSVRIDGGVSMIARQAAVDRFQNDPSCTLFIGNIKAAGAGITLTAASNVAFMEFPWSPGELVQAEDRCHRIGQQDAVNVWMLVAHNTIETHICSLLEQKAAVLADILDGKEAELSILPELYAQLRS